MKNIIDFFSDSNNFLHHVWFLAILAIVGHVLLFMWLCKKAQGESKNATIDKMISDMQKDKRD